MKNLSISISGSGIVSDEAAAKAQELVDALKDSGIYTSLTVSDAPEPQD